MTARRVAPGLRLLAALRLGAVLAARPRSRMAHVYRGPLTATGRFVPHKHGGLCGQHTRRLVVLHGGKDDLVATGRRVCRRCSAALPDAPWGTAAEHRPLIRLDSWPVAFSMLTIEDLYQAAEWTRDADECWQVARLTDRLFGLAPMKPASALTDAEAYRVEIDRILRDRRHRFENAQRTPEERAELEAQREHATFAAAVNEASRRKQLAIEKAQQRARRGQYLTPGERELLNSA